MNCMVDVSTRLGGYIKKVLLDQMDLIKHDWDVVNQVVGFEGDGKTTFVKLASLFQNPTITIDQWAYNAEQFEKIVDREDLPRGSCIVWDESDDLSGKWSNEVVMALKRKFKRIRKKGYVIWLVTPTFFDLNKYWALFRTRCLWDVYAEPTRNQSGTFEANRGRVRFFNRDKKRQLYLKGYKMWDMNCIMPNFIDRFSKVPVDYPVDETLLEHKKDEAMKNLLNPKNKDCISLDRAKIMYRLDAWYSQKTGLRMTKPDFAAIFDVSVSTVKIDKRKMTGLIRENGASDGTGVGFTARQGIKD